MDVVSVNVGRDDAALLLRLLDAELGRCSCQSGLGRDRCDRCAALGEIRSGLVHVLSERPRRRARIGSVSGPGQVDALVADSHLTSDMFAC